MASGAQEYGEPQKHKVGEHWSGTNKVPTVGKFIQHLDREKKERDKRIDQENVAKEEKTQRQNEQKRRGEQPEGTQNGDAEEHKPREVSQAKVRTVTDPTTGKDIGVEDQDEESMATVNDPKVCPSGRACIEALIDWTLVDCS